MAKGTRVSALRQAKMNNSSKTFTHNGKTYREADNTIHNINGSEYIQLEFKYNGKWHKVKNAGTMINIYKMRHKSN